MPGPRNRPRKQKKKKAKTSPTPVVQTPQTPPTSDERLPSLEPPEEVQPEVHHVAEPGQPDERFAAGNRSYLDPSGAGPKLSGVADFLETPYADPPALWDVRYSPFARHDVLDVLRRYLPEELALIVWYNKSRKDARICAACRRFYHLGDTLPSLGPGDVVLPELDPRCAQERRISGLCTFMCFGVAAYNTPGAGGAWGKMESQLDAETAWAINNPQVPLVDDEGLGALFKLTRRADVGVGHYIDLLQGRATTTGVQY